MTTRELDAFIEEHVMGQKPERWSNEAQKKIPCGWFEEYRVHNIDSGGDVRLIDFVANYSTNASAAERVVRAMHQRGYMMDLWYGDHVQVWFKDAGGVRVQHSYARGSSFAEAVCRAAFNTLKPDAIAATLEG